MEKPFLKFDRPKYWSVCSLVALAAIASLAAWLLMSPHISDSETARPDGVTWQGTPFDRNTGSQNAQQKQGEGTSAWMSSEAGRVEGASHSVLPDLDGSQWTALRQATQGLPNAQAELDRLVAYTRFQKGIELWRSLHEQGGGLPQRQELARELLRTVPTHLEQNELMPEEAQTVQVALLEDAEPNAVHRASLLKQHRAQIDAIAKRQSEQAIAQDSARTAQMHELQSRQAEIVRQCQSRTGGSCDPGTLEAELQAARVAVFGN